MILYISFSGWGPEQSPCSRQTDVLRDSAWKFFHSFYVHRWFCQISGGKTFTLEALSPIAPHWLWDCKNTAWYHLESPYSNAISDYYYR